MSLDMDVFYFTVLYMGSTLLLVTIAVWVVSSNYKLALFRCVFFFIFWIFLEFLKLLKLGWNLTRIGDGRLWKVSSLVTLLDSSVLELLPNQALESCPLLKKDSWVGVGFWIPFIDFVSLRYGYFLFQKKKYKIWILLVWPFFFVE